MIIHGTTVALNALIQLKGAKVGLLLHPRPRGLARDPERAQGGRAPLRLPLPAGDHARAAAAADPRHRARPERRPRTDAARRGRRPRAESSSSGARASRRSASRSSGRSSTPSTSGAPASSSRGAPGRARDAVGRPAAADPRVHAHEHRRGERVRRSRSSPATSGQSRRCSPGSATANPLRYVQSNGGLTSGRTFVQRAVSALNSGPAAGPSASLHFATSLGRPQRADARHGRHELGHLARTATGASISSRTSTSAATGSASRS